MFCLLKAVLLLCSDYIRHGLPLAGFSNQNSHKQRLLVMEQLQQALKHKAHTAMELLHKGGGEVFAAARVFLVLNLEILEDCSVIMV